MSGGVVDLIAEARAQGFTLHLDDSGTLKIRGPRERAPAPELVERLRAAKPALLVLLGSTPGLDTQIPTSSIPAEWRGAVARLSDTPCPALLMPTRWARLVVEAGRFMGSDWAPRAALLGWDIRALLGCHARRPLDRLDCRGALWSFDGHDVVALTAEAITVRTPRSRSTLSCHRPRPAATEQVVMPWQLAAEAPISGNAENGGPPDAA